MPLSRSNEYLRLDIQRHVARRAALDLVVAGQDHGQPGLQPLVAPCPSSPSASMVMMTLSLDFLPAHPGRLARERLERAEDVTRKDRGVERVGDRDLQKPVAFVPDHPAVAEARVLAGLDDEPDDDVGRPAAPARSRRRARSHLSMSLLVKARPALRSPSTTILLMSRPMRSLIPSKMWSSSSQ